MANHISSLIVKEYQKKKCKMDAQARLVAAVIHGAALKEGTSPIAAGRTAAHAAGSEAHWLGGNDEEKARVASWMEADLSNDKLVIGEFIVLGASVDALQRALLVCFRRSCELTLERNHVTLENR